jgi:hypothetical protein
VCAESREVDGDHSLQTRQIQDPYAVERSAGGVAHDL